MVEMHTQRKGIDIVLAVLLGVLFGFVLNNGIAECANLFWNSKGRNKVLLHALIFCCIREAFTVFVASV